jgi:RND family efflux transporter MFP subunit
MKRFLKIVLPLIIVAAASVAAVAIIKSKPPVEVRHPEVLPPLVRTETVALTDLTFSVSSQGTVVPRTESRLVPEVSGRVIWVAPSFETGGFFEEGESLLRIDVSDYEQILIRARASVAQAELRLAQEEAEARVARAEWEELGGDEEAQPLTLREPQLAEARAALESAKAAREQAELDLERTEVKAPYAGRVREKLVDLGQFVNRGTAVARIYSVDFAEVRLPIPDYELAYLDLPLRYRGEEAPQSGPRVTLSTNFAGMRCKWEGRIVRTEGEIDPASRMVHAVARVKDPYARGDDADRPPLAAGMFVNAEIEGKNAKDVAVLPRAALHGTNRVWVVDQDDRLRFREVELLRTTRTEIVIRSGLEAGERICLSPLEAVTDGMQVRTNKPEEAQGEES